MKENYFIIWLHNITIARTTQIKIPGPPLYLDVYHSQKKIEWLVSWIGDPHKWRLRLNSNAG